MKRHLWSSQHITRTKCVSNDVSKVRAYKSNNNSFFVVNGQPPSSYNPFIFGFIPNNQIDLPEQTAFCYRSWKQIDLDVHSARTAGTITMTSNQAIQIQGELHTEVTVFKYLGLVWH